MAFVAGHFGEWLQGCAGPGGKVALVTLACPGRGVRVVCAAADALSVSDPSGLLDRDRSAGFLAALGMPPRGRITVTADLPPGGGAGMSTAALVALGRAVGAPGERIAAACLRAEGAVDPLMLDAPDAVLWAPRAARVLAMVPAPPRAEIVGGFWGPPLRTDPADLRFPAIDDLIGAWAAAPDLRQAARLASLSAERCTDLRGPGSDPTAGLAVRLGALGWARAHTGSARALIYPPGEVPDGVEGALREAGYSQVLRFTTGGRA
jgi:uncharacterized protein involved in propanediol utilization